MRLDVYLVDSRMVSTRSKASDLIKRKLCLINGNVATKPGMEVNGSENIEIIEKFSYVSRAGEKLKDAVASFGIDFKDVLVIDVGSSTGGFTDCSLQEGAKFVYAYDVGDNQFDSNLKKDSRIELHENTNILDVVLPKSDMVLIDVSFTSVIPIISHFMSHDSEYIVLIKPQYEAGKTFFKGGILKDKKLHVEIVLKVLDFIKTLGFYPYNFKPSILKGKTGNQEYLLYFGTKKKDISVNNDEIKGMIKC